MASGLIHRLRISLDRGWGLALIAVFIAVEVITAERLIGGRTGPVIAAAAALLSGIILFLAWPTRRMRRLWYGVVVAAIMIAATVYTASRFGVIPSFTPDLMAYSWLPRERYWLSGEWLPEIILVLVSIGLAVC